MKKIISLSVIAVLTMYLQSCRQNDETVFTQKPNDDENIFGKRGERAVGDTITVNDAEGDPPIRSGTHWRQGN